MVIDGSFSRRRFLRLLAGSAAVAAVPTLVACGGDADAPATSGTQATTPASTAGTATATEASGSTPTATATSGSTATATATSTPEALGGQLTVYSGRSERLIQDLVDTFADESGIEVKVRYGDSAELAAAILEEGSNSPADVFFAQDAGALGAVAGEGLFTTLPPELLDLVDTRFRSPDGLWVGISARARAVIYNTDRLSEADLPASILDFTDPVWKGRLAWAPPNASFQSFVTALRVLRGEDVAREWLEGIKANDVKMFEGNTAIVRAVVAGEVDTGFVNHYYLHQELAQAGTDLPARNYIYRNGDPGALVNVAGAGILTTGKHQPQAEAFVRYLLGEEGQAYFADRTYEYPLVDGVAADPMLVPLSEIQTPDIDLSNLADLKGTLDLLRDVGVL